MLRCFQILSLALMLLISAGCDKGPDFTYGKAGDRSVNGLSVFAQLLRQQGHLVTQKRRITKRLERFDTIIWAPDNAGLPPENAVAWLEEWLAEPNASRVLIYIGRDYDGEHPFHRSMVKCAPPKDREAWQRAFNELMTRRSDHGNSFMGLSNGSDVSWWYEEETNLDLDTSQIDGPWAEDVDPHSLNLHCDALLKPLKTYNDDDSAPELILLQPEEKSVGYYYDPNDGWTFREQSLSTKNLLTVDGKPFAFEVTPPQSGDGKLIVVSNGSFLLNFPLANPECRKLASKVAQEVTGDVVFIESGWRWPKVGGEANDPKMQWSWVAQAPMNFIVPHFLFWGVLYCFAFYPNFGRPRRVQFHPPKAFRSHVKAVAAILGRSKESSWARQVVDMWLKRNNKTKG